MTKKYQELWQNVDIILFTDSEIFGGAGKNSSNSEWYWLWISVYELVFYSYLEVLWLQRFGFNHDLISYACQQMEYPIFLTWLREF